MESYCLIVQRSVGDDAKVPETDSDNGWTTFWMYLMLQNYSLKNENIIMFIYIYIFFLLWSKVFKNIPTIGNHIHTQTLTILWFKEQLNNCLILNDNILSNLYWWGKTLTLNVYVNKNERLMHYEVWRKIIELNQIKWKEKEIYMNINAWNRVCWER